MHHPIPFINGAYRTPCAKAPLLVRVSPATAFYTMILDTVFRTGWLAKTGRYPLEKCVESSIEILRAAERIGGSVEITGTGNITAADGPCVFISNHMSALEALILPGIIKPFKRCTFVVKESLINYPVFGHIARSLDPIIVSRTNPRFDLQTVLSGGVDRLSRGISVVIFPQARRTALPDIQEFNSIGIKLAKKAGVPVIPIALKTDLWGNGAKVKEVGAIDPSKKVHIAFGRPMTIGHRGEEEHRAVISFITGKLKEWRRQT